jgi:nucleoid DNA-binding protein
MVIEIIDVARINIKNRNLIPLLVQVIESSIAQIEEKTHVRIRGLPNHKVPERIPRQLDRLPCGNFAVRIRAIRLVVDFGERRPHDEHGQEQSKSRQNLVWRR